MQRNSIKNLEHQNDDHIVRSLRAFGLLSLDHTYHDPVEDFLVNGSPPQDIDQLKWCDKREQEYHKGYNKRYGNNNILRYFKRTEQTGLKNRQKTKTGSDHCVFCRNNDEPPEVVRSHTVRDVFGRVLCPKLRVYICPICSSSGDLAHTIKYCPQKPVITMEDSIILENLKYDINGKKLEKFR